MTSGFDKRLKAWASGRPSATTTRKSSDPCRYRGPGVTPGPR